MVKDYTVLIDMNLSKRKKNQRSSNFLFRHLLGYIKGVFAEIKSSRTGGVDFIICLGIGVKLNNILIELRQELENIVTYLLVTPVFKGF